MNRKSFRAEKHLQSYLDPWDTTSVNPVIPDGKTGMSCGLRFNNAKAVDIGQNGELYMAIFPGLNSSCNWINSQLVRSDFKKDEFTSTQDVTLNEGLINNASISFDRRLFTNTINGLFAPQPASPITIDTWEQPADHILARWRIVSQGVKISCIGNISKDDGWFEAIRVPVRTHAVDATLGTPWEHVAGPNWIDKRTSGTAPHHAAPNLTNRYWKNINFANHPSYVHDKLRNIHKYRFDLAPIGTDHSWNEMENTIKMNKNFNGQGETIRRNYAQELLFTQTVDTTYDMILIKIHGRKVKYNPTQPDSLYKLTRLLVHGVQNQELVYADACLSARLHETAQGVPDKVMKDATIAKGQALQKAATPAKGLKTVVSNIFKKRNRVTDPNDPDGPASKKYKVSPIEPDDAPSSSHGAKRGATDQRPDYTPSGYQPAKKRRRKGD